MTFYKLFYVNVRYFLVVTLAIAYAIFSVLDPLRQGKIDSLTDVVSRIETRVIGLWLANHELSRSLHNFVQLDTVFKQNRRLNQGRFVSQEFVTVFKFLVVVTSRQASELFITT